MGKITSFFLSMLLAVLAMPLQAAVEPEVSIDQEFTDLASLDGKAFAIVNKETGKALFGSGAQNLAYDVLSKAFVETNSGYYFKLAAPSADASDESIASCYLLRLVTPAGEDYNLWGNNGCCLNSQPADGGCSFILGLSDKNGQDIKNGAVFDIQYVDGKGFTLLNKGTGKYLNDNAPAKYDEPVYWTFCTLKKTDRAAGEEELLPLTNEIATAKALGVDVSAWEGKTYLLSEVANAVNEVKVAEYNHVVGSYPTNASSLIPDFAAWEGGMVPNKGQHWDGTGTSTYYEQTGSQWGQDSWTNSKATKVTLAKGKYVLYAAGRASAGGTCSSYIKMNETTVKFPSNGDVGLGINTSGAASFDSNDTFANGNKGRGFEYRYIAFEVTAEEGEEITLAVGGEATSNNQWMSICVPTLLTTADNVGLLKATLTKEIESAKTIVDAKANVGNAPFCIPEAAYNTFAEAVEAAQAANDKAEATAETLAAARQALADAVAAYQATPVNAPAAGKQYILSLNVPEGNAPVAMSITSDKISVESTGTPVTFVAQGNGGFALSNGTEYVVYDGGNAWTLKAAAAAYAWTIAPAEGGYTIQGKNGLLGTNKNEVAAGTTCYGDKSGDDNVVWSIAEYIAKYKVSVAEGIENGTVAVDAEEAEEGATVTITATPAEGYKLEAISVKNGEADVKVSAENTFIMPAADVVVSATFVKEQEDFIAEEFTSVESLYNQAFAIVNKETGKVLYGSKDQNLGYDVPANAFVETNSGYYFKIDKAAGVEGNLLRLMTPAGAEYTFWGDKKGYLNSQPATGWCSFILDLNNQNGQDIENGAVWEIEYVDGKGFTLKNVGTGLYLNDASPAKYEEPAYWTFCTIKGFEAPEVTTGIDAVGAVKAANGKYVENGKVYIVKDGKKISVAGFTIK